MPEETTGYDVREELDDLLRRDLLGPFDGDTEELRHSTQPGERYILGTLVPRQPDDDDPLPPPPRRWSRHSSVPST